MPLIVHLKISLNFHWPQNSPFESRAPFLHKLLWTSFFLRYLNFGHTWNNVTALKWLGQKVSYLLYMKRISMVCFTWLSAFLTQFYGYCNEEMRKTAQIKPNDHEACEYFRAPWTQKETVNSSEKELELQFKNGTRRQLSVLVHCRS